VRKKCLIKAEGFPGCDENNLVHSERFQVYKMPIWAVKTEIVGIAPTLGQQRRTECGAVKEYGEAL
jgi:hypothetical protein